MHRFFVGEEAFKDGGFTVTGGDVHHLTRVLRLVPGDQIALSDGAGREYVGIITGISADQVTGTVERAAVVQSEPAVAVTLFQGLPKADKMELIIQKGTEIGVSRIIPVATERCVVRLDDKAAAGKVERWQKIAREAAKQCGRSRIPSVGPVLSLKQAVEREAAGLDLALIPWELARDKTLKQALRQAGGVRSLGLFIGPEGGLAPVEVECAAAAGVIPVTLGPRILRTETAGLVAATIALYELADLGG